MCPRGFFTKIRFFCCLSEASDIDSYLDLPKAVIWKLETYHILNAISVSVILSLRHLYASHFIVIQNVGCTTDLFILLNLLVKI